MGYVRKELSQRLWRERSSPLRGTPSVTASPAREGQWLRPYPSPPFGGSLPIPNTCAPLRGYPAFCRLARACSARWAVLTHIFKCRVAAKRRTQGLSAGLAPPSWGWVPPSVLTDGLTPPAWRVPQMHLAAHFKSALDLTCHCCCMCIFRTKSAIRLDLDVSLGRSGASRLSSLERIPVGSTTRVSIS